MLTKTNIPVTFTLDEVLQALDSLPDNDFRYTLNEPQGDFIYDPWQLKDQYKNTIWDRLLASLPEPIGEARVIVIDPGQCYQSHSDIDNRYHLNLVGNEFCYFANLDDSTLIPLPLDQAWYEFNAAPRHSAINFGCTPRAQLVVRRLLTRNHLADPVRILVRSLVDPERTRWLGENLLTGWFNLQQSQGQITNVQILDFGQISMDINRDLIPELRDLLPLEFELVCY